MLYGSFCVLCVCVCVSMARMTAMYIRCTVLLFLLYNFTYTYRARDSHIDTLKLLLYIKYGSIYYYYKSNERSVREGPE